MPPHALTLRVEAQVRGELWSRFSEDTPFIRVKIGKGIAGSVAATPTVGAATTKESANAAADAARKPSRRRVFV